MSEPMSAERRAEIEAYLSDWAKEDDEPWTIPDMLRETLTEADRLCARIAELEAQVTRPDEILAYLRERCEHTCLEGFEHGGRKYGGEHAPNCPVADLALEIETRPDHSDLSRVMRDPDE